MKVLLFLLRLIGVILALISLLFFASDFMPVDGFKFGAWESSDAEHMYFKVVPAGGAINTVLFAFLSAVASAIFFILPSIINKNIKGSETHK